MGNESDSPRSEDDHRQSQAICSEFPLELHLNTSSKYWPIESHGMNHCLMKNNMTILYACNFAEISRDKQAVQETQLIVSLALITAHYLSIHPAICSSL